MLFFKKERGRKDLDMATITQIITSVGFPIAMCVGLLYYLMKQSENRKEETTQFTQALNNNTLILQRLCDKLDVESGVKQVG